VDSSASETPRRPSVGLTTYLQQAQTGVWDVRASFLPAVYVEGVTSAGGIALLLPPQPVDDAVVKRVLDGLDGLVITGGRDVDPASYGQAPHPSTDEPARDRDAWEFALVRGALARGLPLLGICRGAQVLNVALGGTLHQHLPDVVGHGEHRRVLGTFAGADHDVRLAAGSLAARSAGEEVHVTKSHHHQGVDELGNGLVVTGRSDLDELPEAIELPDRRFALGVQWHPEADERSRLIGALVEEAAQAAAARAA
jgi:putative glutamine amidotransferase